MNSQQYSNIYNYLTYQQYSTQYTPLQQLQLQKQAKYFKTENNLLYKFDQNNSENVLRVIQKHELSALLYMMHNDLTSEHFATNAMFNKIKNRFYWPQFYEDIRNYVKSCNKCQRRERSIRNNLLHPIPVHSPFYQIGIDIVGPLSRTARNKKYIVVAIDYLTK